jgi:phosphoglycolate phosphatase
VFDLDGTLVDSLRDVAEAFNECLDLLGLPMHPIEHYRYMVGEGVPKLCQRAIGDAYPHLLDRLIELARPRYRTRVIRCTRPYAGVIELVQRLAATTITLAVLSNKPHDLTQIVVRRFWPEGEFERVQGYMAEEGRKPDPRAFLQICEERNVEPADACMIGDTPTDLETAKNAGAQFLGVSWGFRTHDDLVAAGAERIAKTPREVIVALGLGSDLRL